MPPRTEPAVPPGRYSDYFADPEVHARLTADSDRLRLFREALERVIQPGFCVMDLGAGTGVLTRMALDLQAGHIVALEQNPGLFATQDRQMVEALANGTVNLVEQNSLRWEGKSYRQKIDVIVSETIGTFGINEGILPTLSDACSRFLKHGGRTVPFAIGVDIFLIPTQGSEVPHVAFGTEVECDAQFVGSLSFSIATASGELARQSLSMEIPAGNWMLGVSPRACLSADIGFSRETTPRSFGRGVLPIGKMARRSAAMFTLESDETFATARLELVASAIPVFSYRWHY